MAKVSTLVDTFDGPGINASLWNNPNPNNTQVANGLLEITTSKVAALYFPLFSQADYDCTNSQAACQLVNPGNQSLASLEVSPIVFNTTDGTGSLYFLLSKNCLSAWQKVAGTYNVLTPAYPPWDPVNQKWFRIRESNGSVYFETAPDGRGWTIFYGPFADPFDMTNLQVSIDVGTYNVEASTTMVQFDNYNSLPTMAGQSAGLAISRAKLTVIVTYKLTGVSKGSSSVRGSLMVNAPRPVTGRMQGTSQVWGSLTATARLPGRALATSRVTGRLARAFTSTSIGQSRVYARVSIINTFTAGRTSGVSLVDAHLLIGRNQRGISTGQSLVHGRVLAICEVHGHSVGSSQARGKLIAKATNHLGGVSRGTSTVIGHLHIGVNLRGRSLASGRSRGRIMASTGKLLNGRSMASSNAYGKLTVLGTPFTGWGTPIEA